MRGCERILFGGHALIRIQAGDELDERAFCAIPRDDVGGVVGAPGQGGGFDIEPVIGALFFGAVAGKAGAGEDGLHILNKVDRVPGGWGERGGLRSDGAQ